MILTYLLPILMVFFSCNSYLDIKPDRKLQIPTTETDLWAVLDNNELMNRSSPWMGEASADSYYLLDADFNSMSEYNKNLYTWGSPSIQDITPNNWSDVYRQIYYSNVVLDALSKVKISHRDNYEILRGSALLFRGRAFLEAMWIWADAYDEVTADKDLGIPLRLSSDINVQTKRASVKECYQQIFSDLSEAAILLPKSSEHAMRPTKAAAYGFLARMALSMRDYVNAAEYADQVLKLQNSLMDFENINNTPNYPIQRFNEEVIMHFRCSASFSSRMKVNQTLYDSYEENDLRKKMFFRLNADGSYNFKGGYDNTFYLFSGITTSEMLITRAECFARIEKLNEALADINRLRKHRFKEEDYYPLEISNDLLEIILTERRKELLLRGLRFIDIKRLNKEGREIKPVRVVNGKEFKIEPNSPRYALPIPEIIIDITGISQN